MRALHNFLSEEDVDLLYEVAKQECRTPERQAEYFVVRMLRGIRKHRSGANGYAPNQVVAEQVMGPLSSRDFGYGPHDVDVDHSGGGDP